MAGADAAEEITVCHIHYDCRRALSFEAHTHEVLQMMIQCDLHVRAGVGGSSASSRMVLPPALTSTR